MKFNIYKFNTQLKPVLTRWTAQRIIDSIKQGLKSTLVTLDLGLSWRFIECSGREVNLDDNVIDLEVLEKIAVDDRNYVYIVEEGKVYKLATYVNGKFYKLKALGEDVSPTLEINGIHMHRIEGVTPWNDAKAKVESIGVSRGDVVLDIGTGLGYTTSWSILRGASKVVTVDVDANVLKIAEYNPWSYLLSSERVSVILGDAYEVVEEFDNEYFTAIIHDPPRFQLAGHLYSEEFYRELYRILRKGGRLYHYVGHPLSVRGVDMVRGVIRRLSNVGFKVMRRDDIGGVVAFKD